MHEIAEGLLSSGAIDEARMREYDKDCLISAPPFSPEEIREIRERQHLTQLAFARYLSVSKNLVSDWERGVKKPGGPARRLLTLIKHKGLEAISL
jgi:putative transcriptional regulator